MGYWDNGFWVPSDISTLGADYGTPKDQFLRDVGNVEHAMYIPFDGTSSYTTRDQLNQCWSLVDLSKKTDEPVFAWPVDEDNVSEPTFVNRPGLKRPRK